MNVKLCEVATAIMSAQQKNGAFASESLARAAIRAMRAPTEEMIRCGDVLHGLTRADVLEIWEAMCDEAAR